MRSVKILGDLKSYVKKRAWSCNLPCAAFKSNPDLQISTCMGTFELYSQITDAALLVLKPCYRVQAHQIAEIF